MEEFKPDEPNTMDIGQGEQFACQATSSSSVLAAETATANGVPVCRRSGTGLPADPAMIANIPSAALANNAAASFPNALKPISAVCSNVSYRISFFDIFVFCGQSGHGNDLIFSG